MKVFAGKPDASPRPAEPTAPTASARGWEAPRVAAMPAPPSETIAQRTRVPLSRSRPGATPSPTPTGRPAGQRPSTASFSRNERIFAPAAGEGLVYIVRSGCVRLFKTLQDGRSINVGLLGPGTIFAQEDNGDGLASGVTAEALVQSTLSIVAAQDLATLISESPELAAAVVAGMTRRLTDLQTLVEHLLVRDTSVRLSVTLLALADKFGREAADGLHEIGLPLTHQALANMIGSNRVTVTRKLLEFQKDGTVRSAGRNVLAVDIARLQTCAAPANGTVAASPQGK